MMPSSSRKSVAGESRHMSNVRPSITCRATVVGKRVKLGDSDLQVSPICLGTMTFGKQNTEEEAHAQLSWYHNQGGNFLDTAGEADPLLVLARVKVSASYWVKGLQV